MTSKGMAFGFDHFWQPKPREHRGVCTHLPQLGFHIARTRPRLDVTKHRIPWPQYVAAGPSQNLMGLCLTSTRHIIQLGTCQARLATRAVVANIRVFEDPRDVSIFSSSFGSGRQDLLSQSQPMRTWPWKLHHTVEALRGSLCQRIPATANPSPSSPLRCAFTARAHARAGWSGLAAWRRSLKSSLMRQLCETCAALGPCWRPAACQPVCLMPFPSLGLCSSRRWKGL